MHRCSMRTTQASAKIQPMARLILAEMGVTGTKITPILAATTTPKNSLRMRCAVFAKTNMPAAMQKPVPTTIKKLEIYSKETIYQDTHALMLSVQDGAIMKIRI